jgi:hypothetical protein
VPLASDFVAMVKSHRSSSTLFNTWSTSTPASPAKDKVASRDSAYFSLSRHKSTRPTISTTPGSPSQLDPFGSSSNLPSPTVRSRPSSTFSTSTAPRIVLASPSTSTIHYLFPSIDAPNLPAVAPVRLEKSASLSRSSSQSHLGRRSEISKSSKQYRPTLPSTRGSFEQPERELTADRKVSEGTFILTPTRSSSLIKPSASVKILGPSKRIPSLSSVSSIRKKDISKPILPISAPRLSENISRRASVSAGSFPPEEDLEISKFGNYNYTTMRTLRRQPSMADLGVKGKSVRPDPENKDRGQPEVLSRQGSAILKEVDNTRDVLGWGSAIKVSCPVAPLIPGDSFCGPRKQARHDYQV